MLGRIISSLIIKTTPKSSSSSSFACNNIIQQQRTFHQTTCHQAQVNIFSLKNFEFDSKFLSLLSPTIS